MTAARKIEQAMRREPERPERREKAAARNRPAAAEAASFAIRADHPRLFQTGAWPQPTDDVGRQWKALLIRRADDTLTKPPVEYSAIKLLTRSRETLKRLSLLGGVYRLTGEKKYADAGRRELLNVCNFDDWQPSDFLATAEMMNAVAIGYDWLYDALTPAERQTVVRAIADNGLRPALDAYATQGGWTRARHNWNCVCNGGVIVAALAIGNEEPALARQALGEALASIGEGMAAYDENGGTAEGPMYHSYATRYLTFAAAAMETATGNRALEIAAPSRPDPRLKSQETGPAFRRWCLAKRYRMMMTGPSGKVANFGDGSEWLGNTAWVLWLARPNPDRAPDAIAFQASADRDDPSMFDYLWYSPEPADAIQTRERTTLTGPAIQFGSAIVMRDDKAKTFLALRTGGTADHHSHLDLGNFVLDMLGERFALDLGADNYDLPGYLGPRRADYLRSSTPGHNTLSIGNASQPLDAECRAELAKDGRSATIDLTEAYPGTRSVVRSADLQAGVVTLTDTVRTKRDATFVWNLHTPAKVKLTREGALLDSNGKRVKVTILSPADARFTAEPDETRPPELPVNDVTHLRLKVKVEDEAKIEVRFEPG